MSDANKELLQQYQSSLEDLKMNSRPMIMMLTMLAEDNKSDVAEGIVQLIESQIWACPAERKLNYLYLTDSICKTVHEYRPLFAKNLVSNFCHVFESGDETLRKSLHKLKETWKTIFSSQLLRQLDIAVHKLDPAWPISGGKEVEEPASQMHINPKFIKKIDEANKLKENNQQNNNAKLELERLNLKKRLLVERSPSPERKRISPNLWNNLVPSTSIVAPASLSNNHNLNNNSVGFASSIPGLGNLEPASNLTGTNKLSSIPNDITSFSSIQQPSSVVQQQPIMSTIRPASIIQPAPANVLNHLENIPGLNFLANHTVPAATSALNPQASLNINALNTFNSLANINKNQDVDYRINNEFSNPMFNLINNQPPAFTPTQQQQQQPNLMSLGPAELKLQVDGAIRKLYYLDDHTAIVLMNCLVDLPFEELRHCKPKDLAPRLICFEGPPVNVYIDDRYTILLAFNDQWKTFYHLGIEQRIRFGGPAKEICLNNQTIQAKFGGDPVPCELIGDSLTHILRLGQPAPKVKLSDQLREDLWSALLKKYPPINHSNNQLNINNLTNNINNLTQMNAIRPPFERQPVMQAPGIMSLMHPVSSVINPAAVLVQPNQQAIQPATIIPSQPTNLPQPFIQPASSFSGVSSFYPGALLANSKDQQQKSQKQQSQQQKAIREKHQNAKEHHQKHGESANHGKLEKRTKKQKAAAATKEPYLELKPESLKIKRQSLIDSLYSGRQCTNCSLRFDNRTDKGKATYAAHLDWHFRQKRKIRDNSFKTSHLNRDWYLPLDLWLKYKEINMADDSDQMQNGQFAETGINPMPNENDQEAVVLPLLIKAFGDRELNKCAFCGDYFNEKWVDGVDEWRLENAIYGRDENDEEVVCHPTCLSDKQNKSIEDEATMKSEDTILRISESMLESYDPTTELEKEETTDTLEKNENILSSINGDEQMESDEKPKVEVDQSEPAVEKTVPEEQEEERTAESEAEPIKEDESVLKSDERTSPEKESSNDSSTSLNGRLSQSSKEFEADLKVEIIGLAMSEVVEENESAGRESPPEGEQPVKKIELVQATARKPGPLKLNMKSSNLDLVNNQRKAEKEASSPKSENSKSPVNYLEQVARDENVIYRGKEESALCSIM